MDDSSPHEKRPGSRWALAVIAILLVGAPFGVNAALLLSPGSDSPAAGHAQVVTQGLIEESADQVVWRLVERSARPRWDAIPARRVNGFIFASEEPVLLSLYSEDDASLSDIARLAPGEAMMVTDVNRTVRASFTDTSTRYMVLELVPVGVADQVGSGILLFTSDPFTPPPGKRDVDLVRDVLTQGESTNVPDSGNQNVILATEGAIDVIPSDGRTTRLEAGESATFTGELEIQAAQPATSALPVSALTAYIAQDTSGRSSFVTAVIGDEVLPPITATPSPTVTPLPTATLVPTLPPVDTEVPQPTSTSAPVEPTSTLEPPLKPTFTPTLPPPPPTDTPTPPLLDSDGDGLADDVEMQLGTNPQDPDSDDDQLSDGDEVNVYGTNPLNRNTDGDGRQCTDGFEVNDGDPNTNPLVKDCPVIE